MTNTHSFHIPVMGIGFTIDTPLKVAQYGIDSVIFISDDILLEKVRKMYCEKFEIPYKEITNKFEDYRAKRVTSYLNLIHDSAKQKIDSLKNATAEKSNEIKEYFEMLPDSSDLKREFNKLTEKYFNLEEIKDWLKKSLSMGSIDVNIMTKLDRENYKNDEQLPVEFNDAHAALRGYANSCLDSSIVFSAGMNPRLYSYIENFEDFYPNKEGVIKKKIILKVSDYRSALIQGKFLAKKGIWVSEYRIESGLNCGGHAFASDGYLMGPILEEFNSNKDDLIKELHDILLPALTAKNKVVPESFLDLKISAQGGVGTAEEHQFLLDHYKVDSVGWGTPFLLVPEATTVDEKTIQKLVEAKEEDLYLSDISPLGVPFNNLKGNSKELEKLDFIAKGRPGSSCPKKYLSLNKEFTDTSICAASRQYQHLKIKELEAAELPAEEHQNKFDKIVEKSCLCVGLGVTPLLVNDIDHKTEGDAVLICPGPNMAYFSKVISLKEMVDHIYGRGNVISRTDRPNMFIKELFIYLDYFKNKLADAKISFGRKEEKQLSLSFENLKNGIEYYHKLFSQKIKNSGDSLEKLAVCSLQVDLFGKELQLIIEQNKK